MAWQSLSVEAGRAAAPAEGGSSQSLRSSASKPRQHHRRNIRQRGTKAGNDRWSEGWQEGGTAMNTPRQENPPPVPATDKQGGEVRARWAWTEAAVWTEPMLTSLERGVKGGMWFSLIDKAWNARSLEAAWRKVLRNRGAAGVDRQSVAQFKRDAAAELDRLHRQLQEESCQPQPVRRTWIEKMGSKELRPLGIPSVRDRGSPDALPPLVPGAAASVVQGALKHALEPIFERDFSEHSFGFRPGRSAKDALRRVDKRLHEGRIWVVDADIKGYFDNIPHGQLMEGIERKVSDGRVLAWIGKYLKAGVMESAQEWKPTGQGTPQGAVLSPLLANIGLRGGGARDKRRQVHGRADELDWQMAGEGYAMTRYADDFVILCASRSEAEAALGEVREWCERRGLTLHSEKTRIVDASLAGEGFEFLGYHFERGMKWPRQKSLARLRESIRQRTRRQTGFSLREIIGGVNAVLHGWYDYFKHSKANALATVDGYVRRRLRSILRKRQRLRGTHPAGVDHRRWPNAYFAAQGLFCLSAAQAACRQSR